MLLRVHHDILHRGAERRFDGEGIAVVRLDQIRHRAVYAAQRAAFGFAHDGFDGLGEALVFLFHFGEHVQARLCRAQIDRQRGQAFLLLPQRPLARSRLLRAPLLLCAQIGAALPGLFFRLQLFLLLRLQSSQALARLCCGGNDGVFPIQQFLRLAGQHRDCRAALRQRGADCVLLCKQLGKRAFSRAGVLRVRFDLRDHLLRLLLQRRLFGVDGSQTLAMLRDLRLQRIDAIGLFGDLQAHPFDRFGAVAHVRTQNGGGRFALRRGGLRLGKAGARRLRLQIFFPHFLRNILRRRIKLLQLALRAGEIVLCRPIVAVHRLGLLLQAVERLHPDGDL